MNIASIAEEIGRDLSRRRPNLPRDRRPLASNMIKLFDRLRAGEDPERIRPMLNNQIKFWIGRSEAARHAAGISG